MPYKNCIICGKQFYTKTNGIVCSTICKKRHNVNMTNKYSLQKNPNKLIGIGSGNHPTNKQYNKPHSYHHFKKDKCEICCSTINLLVHHLDGNHNNCCKENLQTVCKQCHQKIHVKRDSKGRFMKQAK